MRSMTAVVFVLGGLTVALTVRAEDRDHVTTSVHPHETDRVFLWGENAAGDCRQRDAVLVLYRDGHAHFSSTTLTLHTHHGDYWHSQIRLKVGNTVVGDSGERTGPRMDDGGPTYPWSFDFRFDASRIDQIDTAWEHSKC
jgi:hypothetical protein